VEAQLLAIAARSPFHGASGGAAVQRNIIQKPPGVFACGQSGWEKVMNMKTLTKNAVV